MGVLSRILALVGLLASLAVLVTAAYLVPAASGHGTHTQLGLAPCGFLAQTGRPCLSCGMTTAFAALIRARPADAWRANPAAIPLFLLTLAAPFWCLHALRTRQDPLRFTRGRRGSLILILLIAPVLVTWMLRSLP